MSKKEERIVHSDEEEMAVPEVEENIENIEEEIEEIEENTPADSQEQLSELEQALAAAEDFKRKWYNVTAEYENYRKRNQLSVAQAYADGKAEAVLKLLPVSDTFGYALEGAADEKTRAGIDKVIKNFNTIIASFGIEEIPVEIGDDFNEAVAEAILNVPCEEGEQPNKVKQILKKGYKQGDKVIRFAQVIVTI